MNSAGNILSRYSYWLLSLILIFLESFYILKGEWRGDFWEHSAVVKELSVNFFHPSHPMLNIDAPHAFFSPYTLIVALFAKITGLNSIKALQYFAFFNLLFFIGALYFFCIKLFKQHAHLIVGGALVFILLFWGSSPFLWSGFYHLFILNYILPYPSTFAMCLSLLTLGILAGKKPALDLRTALIILLVAIVFLTHPYTGIFLGIASAGLILTFYMPTGKEGLISLCIVAIPSFLVCCAWPYYNFLSLFSGSNGEFHEISQSLYSRTIGIHWPILLVFPFALLMERSKAGNFLIFTISLMLLFYIAGFIFKFYGFGRIIAGTILLSHIFIAYALVILFFIKNKIPAKIYMTLICALFLISLFKNTKELKEVFNFSKEADVTYYTRYAFLESFVSHKKLILSDQLSNWYIPSYGGKVVASLHPLFSIEDGQEREEAVETFFGTKTDDLTRQAILLNYSPDFILLDFKTNSLDQKTIVWLESIGTTIYRKNDIELIKLKNKD